MKFKAGDKVVILDVPSMYESREHIPNPDWTYAMDYLIGGTYEIERMSGAYYRIEDWSFLPEWIRPTRSVGVLEGVLKKDD